jgi:hypothetical protein
MIHYQCQGCQAIHTAPDLLAGLTVICKQCRQPILVPKTSTVAPPMLEAKPEAPQVAASMPKTMAREPESVRETPAEFGASRGKPMMRWLILVLLAVLTPLAYLAWRFFVSS